MNLIKSSFWNALGTIIRVLASFLSNKIVSIVAGTYGIVVLGQFINFYNIVVTLANGAINNGIIKYSSEYSDDNNNLKKVISSSFLITLVCSISLSITIYFFSERLSTLLFQTDRFVLLIKVFAISLLFQAFSNSLLSCLTGSMRVRSVVIINCLGSLFSLLLTYLLTTSFHVYGALASIVLVPVLTVPIVIYHARGLVWFNKNYLFGNSSYKWIKKLLIYSMMAVATSFSMPIAQILIRKLLLGRFGIDSAGYWQGMFRISDGYLLIITTTLTSYYLPKLSRLTDTKEMRGEVLSAFKLIIPCTIIISTLVYLTRIPIIKLLYSEEFIPMETLFLSQLTGDVFKVASWLLVYVLHAKAMVSIYLICEFSTIFLFVCMSYVLTDCFGIQGVTYSYAVSYFVYLLFLLFFFRRLLFVR